jgi:hypothetical protein
MVSSTSVEIDAVLQDVIAKISTVNAVIAVLPESSTEDFEEKRKVRLEYKKILLENRKESYAAVLLEKELELKRVNTNYIYKIGITNNLDEVNA